MCLSIVRQYARPGTIYDATMPAIIIVNEEKSEYTTSENFHTNTSNEKIINGHFVTTCLPLVFVFP